MKKRRDVPVIKRIDIIDRWICSHDRISGSGDTPSEAYAAWLESWQTEQRWKAWRAQKEAVGKPSSKMIYAMCNFGGAP
jgi:hypothetical protein